jgi:hypothetical protein
MSSSPQAQTAAASMLHGSSSIKLPTPPPRGGKRHPPAASATAAPARDYEHENISAVATLGPASRGPDKKPSDTTTSSSRSGSKQKEPEKPWSPSFIGSVTTYTRSGRRDIVFAVNVRSVEEGVDEWTVMRSLNDFKAFRAKIKSLSSGQY